jgi:predicted signal transduction protein with EAL and GGDEF domain
VFSIGVAVYPSEADSIEPLINQAEKRLFESEKESQTLAYKN